MMDDHSDSWIMWSKYVLKELEDLNKRMDAFQECSVNMKIDITKMKERIAIRAAIYGILAAMIPVAVALLIVFLKSP